VDLSCGCSWWRPTGGATRLGVWAYTPASPVLPLEGAGRDPSELTAQGLNVFFSGGGWRWLRWLGGDLRGAGGLGARQWRTRLAAAQLLRAMGDVVGEVSLRQVAADGVGEQVAEVVTALALGLGTHDPHVQVCCRVPFTSCLLTSLAWSWVAISHVATSLQATMRYSQSQAATAKWRTSYL